MFDPDSFLIHIVLLLQVRGRCDDEAGGQSEPCH